MALRPKNTLFCAYTWSLFVAGVQKFRFIIWGYFCVSVLRRCISKKENKEPYGRILTFFVTSTLDRGWSMTLNSALSIVLFALALIGVTRADNQQAQQSSVNAAICTGSSISFVTGWSI